MNAEQKEYISLINRSDKDEILIKKTGWEEINLAGHAHHGKYQIIYTLSGTLHVQIGAENYFVPEKHIEEFYKLKYCSTVVYMVPRA